MPTVFLRQTRQTYLQKFHKSPDCVKLTKPPARGAAHPLVEVDLRDVPHPNPCYVCYPDAPRVQIVRRYCQICDFGFAKPCPHNGGVKVPTPYKGGIRWQYVWPDRAHHYL
jgi:hypothetical protein